MQLSFTRITEQDLLLAAEFKRRTCIAVMGDDRMFWQWFPPERSYETFAKSFMNDPQALIALVYVSAHAIGLIEGRVRTADDGTRLGWVNNYYLEPEWRGRGLGDQLDHYMMHFLCEHGAKRAVLRTNPQSGVMTFYARRGWGQAETEPDGLVLLHKDIGRLHDE